MTYTNEDMDTCINRFRRDTIIIPALVSPSTREAECHLALAIFPTRA